MRSGSVNIRIIIQLLTLVSVAAMLQYVAFVLIYTHVMIQRETDRLVIVVKNLSEVNTEKNRIIPAPVTRPGSQDTGKFGVCIIEMEETGESEADVFSGKCPGFDDLLISGLATEAKFKKEVLIKRFGAEWHHLSYRNTEIAVVAPSIQNGKAQRVTIGRQSLSPVYQELSQANGYLLAFIALNSILMVIIGYFRMSKYFIRPLTQLAEKVRSYNEDGNLLLDDENPSAFRMLSTRLNSMLHRIEDDKKSLQQTVIELEKSNRALEANKKLLIRSETLASVGRFSAGMAHEIGNPIAIVQGYLELLGSDDISSEDRQQFTGRASGELDRIKKLLDQLLQYARSGEYGESDEVDVHILLHEVLSFLRIENRFKKIKVVEEFTAENPIIWCQYDALKQVIINCLLNSVDAFADIENKDLCLIQLTTALVPSEEDAAKRLLSIYIRDNGPGISPQYIDRVFDPFFTTKDPGKGTGLGLYVCHNIITGYGGTIELKNKLGGGCEVIVRFPEYSKKLTSQVKHPDET